VGARWTGRWLALLLWGLPAWACAAGDPVAGQAKADEERCIECHGKQGQGDGHNGGADVRFPKLAGQHADYLEQQLLKYRGGQRKNDVMKLVVHRLEDEDLRDIAAWFASLPKMRADAPAGAGQAGAALFAQGDPARQVVACANCHGVDGLGVAALTPRPPMLAGQDARYLEQQLLDWRNGWRKDATGSVMNQVTKALSDREIQELAGYLAGLP
jgi:cytochrome c553